MEKKNRYPKGILATCCIPWDESFALDEAMFRRAIRLITDHTQFVYLFGTAGEGYALSREQFSHITSIFVDEMLQRQAEPMISIIGLSLTEMMRRIEIAMNLGVRVFQLALPSWAACTVSEAETFFTHILTRFPDADFLHYNLVRSGRIMEPQEYARLSEKFDNFCGAKITCSSTRYIEELMQMDLPLSFFFTSPGYAYASMCGECGLLIAVASCNWDQAKKYFRAGQERNRELVIKMQTELGAIGRYLKAAVGSSGHIDGVYDKMFLKMHIPEFPLRLLPPYSYAGDDAFQSFRKSVITNFPYWCPENAAGTL